MTLADCVARLESLAPPHLAESWDNVGLLIGDRAEPIHRILTCLTLTPDVAREAIDSQVDLVITHHPVLFRPVQRITSDTVAGAMLLELMRCRISVYSPHTAYDSAAGGINHQIAIGLKLATIAPLRLATGFPLNPATNADSAAVGGGRWGSLPQPLLYRELLANLKTLLRCRGLQFVGDLDRRVARVAIACGAAAEYLADAARVGCDVLITGEARFHDSLEARNLGVALVLAGHYATERPAMESLAQRIQAEWPGIEAWASRVEIDPIQWSLV
jgi:dinuclear metal center YbgI/SA1388 family protein